MASGRHPRSGDPARQERRAARRAQLLEAAVTAIRREGPSVSMEAIATEAGVTKPIVYKHFGDRDGLVQALAAGFVDDLLEELARSLHQQIGPYDLLATTIDAYLGFVERDPDVYRFVVQRAMVDPAANEAMTGVIPRIGQQVAMVLGEQLRAVGADSGPAEPWAFGIVGMVHFAGDWWVDRRTMPRERMVEYLTRLLWEGMRGAAQPVARAETPSLKVVEPAKRATPR